MAFQGELRLVHFSRTLGTLQLLGAVVERDVLLDAVFVICLVVALRTLEFLFTVLLFVFLFEVFVPFVFALEEKETLEEVALDGFMFVHEFHVNKKFSPTINHLSAVQTSVFFHHFHLRVNFLDVSLPLLDALEVRRTVEREVALDGDPKVLLVNVLFQAFGGQCKVAVDALDFVFLLVNFFQVDLFVFLRQEVRGTQIVRTSDCDVLVDYCHVAPQRLVIFEVSSAVDALFHFSIVCGVHTK